MKLTIKQPSRKTEQQTLILTGSSSSSQYLKNNCCCMGTYRPRYTINRPHTKQEQLLYDLVKIDCLAIYSRVNPKVNVDVLSLTIMKIILKMKVKYQPWIGYLCIHCAHHYKIEVQKQAIIEQFIDKFRAAFEQKTCEMSIFEKTKSRVKLYCNDAMVSPSEHTLTTICLKHQETLLLEFLPVQYSKYIIQRYLAEDGDLQQYVRLEASLVHFVLNTTNPVNQSHFIDLMFRPYMGTVEWPIIIANRHMFEQEQTIAPFIQKA